MKKNLAFSRLDFSATHFQDASSISSSRNIPSIDTNWKKLIEKLSYVLIYVVGSILIIGPVSVEAQNPEDMSTYEALKLAIRGKVIKETYGNWFGPGWWGGTTDELEPGNKPPTDAMDEIAMAHDFGYQIAEEQGAIYGDFEESRLKAIADAIAANLARNLTTWTHPPAKPKLAAKNRVIMYETFEFLSPLREDYYSTKYQYLKSYGLINDDKYEKSRYNHTDFLKEVENRIGKWYAKYNIKQILPKVYDPTTPQVGNLPDTKSLQQEAIHLGIKNYDKYDYLKLRQFGATQNEAKDIIELLKQRYVESEKDAAIKIINAISRRNDLYMHYHVDVHIEGKPKVLSNSSVQLKAVVNSKVDKIEYVSYSWSENINSNESSITFSEKTPGKYILTVSVMHLGVEVATSEPFEIIVVDNSNPEIELQIIGPDQVSIDDEILLSTSKKANNEAGELLMEEGKLYIDWKFNDNKFDRGDATRPVFSEPDLHIIKALLMYEDGGEYIIVSEAIKEINVVNKEEAHDPEIVKDPPEENEEIKEDTEEQETKTEDIDSTAKQDETTESDQTLESTSSTNQPLSFTGSTPSIWQGGNDETGFSFTRKEATATFVDVKKDIKNSATVTGKIWGKINDSFAPDNKEELLKQLNEKAKDTKSRFNKRRGLYEAKAVVRPIAIDDFSGYLLESEVNGGGGYWTSSSSANAGSIAWAEGWVFKGNNTIHIEYRISGSGPTNSNLNSFLLSQTRAGQSEAKGILAGLHLINNGEFNSTPYNGPKLDGSDLLKTSLTAFPDKPAFLGQTVEVEAKVSGGKPPYSYAWSGDHGGKGATVLFGSRKEGEHQLSVTVKDARGDDATAEITITVEALDVRIDQTSPSVGTNIFPGSPVEFEVNIIGSKNNKLEILFQPHPEVSFEPFELFNTENNITSTTFPTIGTYNVWAQVYFQDGDSPILVGESEQLTIEVINPDITLIPDNESPFVGENVTIEVQEDPTVKDELIAFWWEIKGGKTLNAGPEANIPNNRVYSFIPTNEDQVTVTVHSKAKNGGADLGKASVSITAQEFQVVASKPKRLDKAPWIWDLKQGKAVELPQAIAVFQDAEVHATLTPKPKEKLRYLWTVSPEGCSISAPMNQSTNLNAHKTGTYQVTVKVSDKNDVVLGEGSISYTVTVSQRDLDVAMQKEADHQKAQTLLEQGRKDWKEGKLEQAITKVSQALKLVGKDHEIAQNLNSMQNQKEEIDEKLTTASDYVKQGKFDDAEKVLSEAANINNKYEKYRAVNHQLTDARKKLAILLQDAITLQTAGKLNEAVELLKKGRTQFPGNNEITDQLKEVQKHQENAQMKMYEGQDQWEKGLLDQALSTLKEASNIDSSNEQIEKSLKDMQDQKDMMDGALADANKLIQQKKLEEAKVLLDNVGSISSQYPSYVAVLKRYDHAKTQVEEMKSNESKPASPIKEQVISASFDAPSSPNVWQRYVISLTAENFGVDAQTFQQVMTNVNDFRIRTEMHNGNDVGGIDAIKIGNTYISDFENGAEGWNAAGDGTMAWISSEGISGGYLQISDWASGDWHWAVAPESWSGNWQSLIGSNIIFYYKTDHPSYSSIVEISNNQQNRLGLVIKPMIIPEESSASISISPFPISSTDLVVSLTSSNTECINVIESVVVPGGQASIESKVHAVAGASECASVIEASAEGYGASRITLSVQAIGIQPQKSTTQEVGNKESVINKPIYPTTFKFDQPVKLLYLRTYHWNNGQGKPPGFLGLRHSDGTLYGLWQSNGLSGQGGVQNAYWVINPNAPLKPGVYTVVDSDPETWSTNEKAGWVGFATIRVEPIATIADETSSVSSDPSQPTKGEYEVVIDNCIGGITKTSSTSAPNSHGDVFNGGHWAGASSNSDWLQLDFESEKNVAGVYIERASTDITTNGFKLVLKLQKPDGTWTTIDELHDTNINRSMLSGGAVGESIPPYTKRLSSAINATAFRLEFYGNGWFDATDIRIFSESVSDTDTGSRVKTHNDDAIIAKSDDASLVLSKTTFEPGENISLNYTQAPKSNAWVGMYHAEQEHGEYNNQEITWKEMKIINGQLEFTAPQEEGEYDFRVYERSNRKELVFLKFSVAVDKAAAGLSLPKTKFEPGEEMTLAFAKSPLQNAWVGMYHAEQEHNQYNNPEITWKEMKIINGQLEFTAPDEEGNYDFRVYERSNRKELVSIEFSVAVNKDAASLSLLKTKFQPGEEMKLSFTKSPLQNAWVGMYHAEQEHNQYNNPEITWKELKIVNGQLEFTAPDEEGNYDFRIYERSNKKELATISFMVK